MAKLIPWDEVCNIYLKHVGVSDTGRQPMNPWVVIGSLIIKHIGNLDDREAVDQISENIYMQHFLGYSSFTSEAPFDALVINTFYEQQQQMYDSRSHRIEDCIVSIHQPQVRPIVRRKSQAKVEFGAKPDQGQA